MKEVVELLFANVGRLAARRVEKAERGRLCVWVRREPGGRELGMKGIGAIQRSEEEHRTGSVNGDSMRTLDTGHWTLVNSQWSQEKRRIEREIRSPSCVHRYGLCAQVGGEERNTDTAENNTLVNFQLVTRGRDLWRGCLEYQVPGKYGVT